MKTLTYCEYCIIATYADFSMSIEAYFDYCDFHLLAIPNLRDAE